MIIFSLKLKNIIIKKLDGVIITIIKYHVNQNPFIDFLLNGPEKINIFSKFTNKYLS